MIRQLSEEGVLFLHVVKWLFLASVVGCLIGATSTGFLLTLNLVINTMTQMAWAYWLLPLGLALSAWITSALVPEAGGQGVERVIRAIHLHSGKMRWQVIPAKVAATILTLGVGGSAGNIGPCVQIGSGLSSFLADTLQFDSYDRKTLVICGLSAGFASIFWGTLSGGDIWHRGVVCRLVGLSSPVPICHCCAGWAFDRFLTRYTQHEFHGFYLSKL